MKRDASISVLNFPSPNCSFYFNIPGFSCPRISKYLNLSTYSHTDPRFFYWDENCLGFPFTFYRNLEAYFCSKINSESLIRFATNFLTTVQFISFYRAVFCNNHMHITSFAFLKIELSYSTQLFRKSSTWQQLCSMTTKLYFSMIITVSISKTDQ